MNFLLFLLLSLSGFNDKCSDKSIQFQFKSDTGKQIEFEVSWSENQWIYHLRNEGFWPERPNEKMGIISNDPGLKLLLKIFDLEEKAKLSKTIFNQSFDRNEAFKIMICNGKIRSSLAVPIEYRGYDFIRNEESIINAIDALIDQLLKQEISWQYK